MSAYSKDSRIDAINNAFDQDVHLKKRIFDAIKETPQHVQLFADIAKYHEFHCGRASANGVAAEPQADEHAVKKRKLAAGVLPIVRSGEPQCQQRIVLEVKDVSFSIPQRKKLHLEICCLGRGRDSGNSEDSLPVYTICTRNPASNEYEFVAPVDRFSYVLCLPVPEKAQKQYNFCLIPSSNFTAGDKATTAEPPVEPLVWTINDGPLKSYSIRDVELEHTLNGSDNILDQVLEFVMKRSGTKVISPDEAEFVSAVPESHRKGEKAFHVKAFRGSKDGFLFFLKNGIFFGFKKPLQFFAFDDVESISYTSVLQRTFNLNISYKPTAESEPQEVEFSMLDQANFSGIDAYVKKHQLQDASMAEARRAKKVNANGVKKGAGTGTAAGAEAEDGAVDERTELQKAEQEMQELEDEEDELEEDYDPGSDGDSDGSGTSGEDEEDADGGDDDDDDDDEAARDLVEEELGSDAEEVEPDMDDGDQL